MRQVLRSSRGGFTIVELLVAIGVLALVAIGLSVIFGSVGDAVTEGRRASEINQAAKRIESQIRDDLERLTRDGYMVVAQRYVSDETGIPLDVQLSPRDRDGRRRRADEIMFFARGDFISKRPPLVAGIQATSNEAAIWYGIGQKRVPDLQSPTRSSNYFFNPFPSDGNLNSVQGQRQRALLGVDNLRNNAANPNEYARDWSLLRQATLLVTPRVTSMTPSDVFGIQRENEIAIGSRLLQDSERQYALQPAARSIFNSLGWTALNRYQNPRGMPSNYDGLSRWWIGDVAEFPGTLSSPAQLSFPMWRSSGVVDIAFGSIASIRSQIQALAAFGRPPGFYYSPAAINPVNPRPANLPQTADQFKEDWLDPTIQPSQSDASSLSLNSHSDALRAWALDSMPSLWNGMEYIAGVRYEETPTRLVFEGGEFPDTDPGRLGRAIAEANQEMLGSQIFVPRVTEFIVEWSYGFVDNGLLFRDPDFKKLIWYGLPRATRDADGDGVIDFNDHQAAPDVVPYYQRAAVSLSDRTKPDPEPYRIMMSPTLPDVPQAYVFGFTDPVGTADPSNDVLVPWPKFIRITMSLADPKEQDQERTFQFVFTVPGEQG